MAFAGIFQPFARLRWIRFGLLMRDRKFLILSNDRLAAQRFSRKTLPQSSRSRHLQRSAFSSRRFIFFALAIRSSISVILRCASVCQRRNAGVPLPNPWKRRLISSISESRALGHIDNFQIVQDAGFVTALPADALSLRQ